MDKIQTQEVYLPNGNPSKVSDNIAIYDATENITVWIEKHTDKYVLSKDQLEKIIGEAFEWGRYPGQVTDYIKSII